MRKVTLLTVLSVLTMVGVHAQGVGLGIKGGMNFANVDVGDINTDNKTGYHFGTFLELGLNENISIQPELLFSTQGAKIEDTQIDFSYLNIPVLLKLKFAEVLNVHVGPQFGILTQAENDNEDIKDFFKSSDISLALGAGVDLPAGLAAGLRYNLGLNDIDDRNGGFDVATKNRVLQIYVGWKLF